MKTLNLVVLLSLGLTTLSSQAIDNTKFYCEDFFAKTLINRSYSDPRGEAIDSLLDVLVTRVYRHADYVITEETLKQKEHIVEVTEPTEYIASILEYFPEFSEEDIYRYGSFIRLYDDINPESELFQNYFSRRGFGELQRRNFLAGVQRVKEHREAQYALKKTIELSKRTDRPYYSPRFVRIGKQIVDIINYPYAYGKRSPNYHEASMLFGRFFPLYINPFAQANIMTVSEMAVDMHFKHEFEGYFKRSLLEDLIPIVETYTGEPVERN